MTDNQTYFFNTDDIEKVWFTGYSDQNELKAQEVFKNQVDKIEYPHFTIEDINQENYADKAPNSNKKEIYILKKDKYITMLMVAALAIPYYKPYMPQYVVRKI